MASKFAQFLTDNKIDPRRLIVASRELERLRPEDRKLKFQKRAAKKAGGPAPAAAADGEEKKGPSKPRSGRPVTPRLIAAVTAGKPVPGPAKTRLVRALNHVLEQKKKPAAELRALFPKSA